MCAWGNQWAPGETSVVHIPRGNISSHYSITSKYLNVNNKLISFQWSFAVVYPYDNTTSHYSIDYNFSLLLILFYNSESTTATDCSCSSRRPHFFILSSIVSSDQFTCLVINFNNVVLLLFVVIFIWVEYFPIPIFIFTCEWIKIS